jgi:MraZ protein
LTQWSPSGIKVELKRRASGLEDPRGQGKRRSGVAELLGEHHYQMDPKGRISLPAKFREAFKAGVHLTLGQEGCLYAFPPDRWNQERGRVEERALADRDSRAYTRIFFGNAEHVDLDAQGRLVVPRRLRDKVRLGRDVAVVGVADRLEIWPEEEWARYAESLESSYQSGSLQAGREKGEGG